MDCIVMDYLDIISIGIAIRAANYENRDPNTTVIDINNKLALLDANFTKETIEAVAGPPDSDGKVDVVIGNLPSRRTVGGYEAQRLGNQILQGDFTRFIALGDGTLLTSSVIRNLETQVRNSPVGQMSMKTQAGEGWGYRALQSNVNLNPPEDMDSITAAIEALGEGKVFTEFVDYLSTADNPQILKGRFLPMRLAPRADYDIPQLARFQRSRSSGCFRVTADKYCKVPQWSTGGSAKPCIEPLPRPKVGEDTTTFASTYCRMVCDNSRLEIPPADKGKVFYVRHEISKIEALGDMLAPNARKSNGGMVILIVALVVASVGAVGLIMSRRNKDEQSKSKSKQKQ
jgi:hypothetical protein